MSKEVAKSYTLSKPISLGDNDQLSDIDFFEPTAKEIRPMPIGVPSIDEVMKFAVTISTIPSDGVFDRFSKKDAEEVIKIALRFLGDGEFEDES